MQRICFQGRVPLSLLVTTHKNNASHLLDKIVLMEKLHQNRIDELTCFFEREKNGLIDKIKYDGEITDQLNSMVELKAAHKVDMINAKQEYVNRMEAFLHRMVDYETSKVEEIESQHASELQSTRNDLLRKSEKEITDLQLSHEMIKEDTRSQISNLTNHLNRSRENNDILQKQLVKCQRDKKESDLKVCQYHSNKTTSVVHLTLIIFLIFSSRGKVASPKWNARKLLQTMP